jgi:hypothetical protein
MNDLLTKKGSHFKCHVMLHALERLNLTKMQKREITVTGGHYQDDYDLTRIHLKLVVFQKRFEDFVDKKND